MSEDLTYEERESADQLLSFNYVQEYMQQHGKRFSQIQKKILKLINERFSLAIPIQREHL